MIVHLFPNRSSLAHAAADHAATSIRATISQLGRCRVVLATGASQLEFLDTLTKARNVDWSKLEAFHLDEYVGLPVTHPASFRKYLLERVIGKTGIQNYHFLEGDAADLESAIEKVSRALTAAPVDIAFVGIGENGHIAFNDPPADFETEDPYIVVNLDDACRRQQVGEGWFTDISQVPTEAISMTPRQILRAQEILAIVPDLRKAGAVKLCLEGEIHPMAPASILRRHSNVTVFLDGDSSSQLSPTLRNKLERESHVTIAA
jgi:glucosamine-6-phosphate deaminase